MPNYDFRTLSPFDFELLCRDLLQRDLGVRLESFTTGRDQGIDFRYAMAEGDSFIVQCKHYADSGFPSLLSNLRNKERPKLERLNPNRYIVATSVGLTPGNKDNLRAELDPYIVEPADIYGRNDLNNLLGQFPDIEEQHFKLWLTSQPVLERVLHNAIFVQSELTKDDIERKLKLYVPTGVVKRAREILDKEHSCIITGIPGIGKTTLAEIILVDFLTRNWQVIVVRENIREALDIYQQNRRAKQIFYYDDFLGRISLGDGLAKNEDAGILKEILSKVVDEEKRAYPLGYLFFPVIPSR